MTIFKGDLIAEVLGFPSEADAEEAPPRPRNGTPTTVAGELVFSGALDDSQADIGKLVEDGGQ